VHTMQRTKHMSPRLGCLFGPFADVSKTRSLKLIWEQTALPQLVADPPIATMQNHLTIFAKGS